MPFIGSPVKATTWDKPKGRLRHVHVLEKERSAIYVVEETPSLRTIRQYGSRYLLPLPWRYFLIKVLPGPRISNEAGAYIFFAERRAESLDDPVLRVPYLPNLFNEGGICPDHRKHYGARTPLEAVVRYIRWFYQSQGNAFFGSNDPPVKYDLYNENKFGYSFLKYWSMVSPEEAGKFDWPKAAHRTLREASEKLSFRYWKRVNMAKDPYNRKRVEEIFMEKKGDKREPVALQGRTDP